MCKLMIRKQKKPLLNSIKHLRLPRHAKCRQFVLDAVAWLSVCTEVYETAGKYCPSSGRAVKERCLYGLGEGSESQYPVFTVQSQDQDLSAEMILDAAGICGLTGQKGGPSHIQNVCVSLYSTHSSLSQVHALLSLSLSSFSMNGIFKSLFFGQVFGWAGVQIIWSQP